MVKIPGLDDLKKMGTGIIDSAKSVKFGEVVDKLKSGIDSVGGKRGGSVPQGDEAIKAGFEALYVSLNELTELQAAQLNTTKKIQNQVSELVKVIIVTQQPTEDTNKP
jgi:hypothetical protein